MLGTTVSVSKQATHIAARAAFDKKIIEDKADEELSVVAIPIDGQLNQKSILLAVVVLHCRTRDLPRSRSFVSELLEQIRPICTYAALRQQSSLLTEGKSSGLHELGLSDVLESILETVCDKLGFTLAAISLVDDDEQEIRTVVGRDISEGWIEAAHHALSSSDIQADILRTQQIEVITEWDPRFDRNIWDTYHHEKLVRVFVPLSDIGTIEAGFRKHQRDYIPAITLDLLKRYARDVTVALRNALLHERQRRHAAALSLMHECNYAWRINPSQYDEDKLLLQIAEHAHNVATLQGRNIRLSGQLRKSAGMDLPLVMLYRLEEASWGRNIGQSFGSPISIGEVGEKDEPLKLPSQSDNIVSRIAADCKPYYASDAQQDSVLNGAALEEPRPRSQTFTIRQKIRSFAGVPLMDQGKVLAILCINYRERHRFSHDDRHIIELFAQQAAAAITSVRLIRARERERFMEDLHDSVKTQVRALTFLHEGVANVLYSNPDLARKRLEEAQSTAWVVLSDVKLILANLVSDGEEDQTLEEMLYEELDRLLGHEQSKVLVDFEPALPMLPSRICRSLIFILSEAIMNGLHHGRANRVSIQAKQYNNQFCLNIEDDGEGFDLTSPVGKIHHGVSIMRTRAEDIGATLELASDVGVGTSVRVILQLTEATSGSN